MREEQVIPEGFLYHTVAITLAGSRMFVTVAFHVTDDMKFSASVSQVAVYTLSTIYTLSTHVIYAY